MKTSIVQDEQKPHAVEIIADSIVQIERDINIVLTHLENLEKNWLKKPVISQKKTEEKK